MLGYRIYHIPTDQYLKNHDMVNSDAYLEFAHHQDAVNYIDKLVTVNNDFSDYNWTIEEFDIREVTDAKYLFNYVSVGSGRGINAQWD